MEELLGMYSVVLLGVLEERSQDRSPALVGQLLVVLQEG